MSHPHLRLVETNDNRWSPYDNPVDRARIEAMAREIERDLRILRWQARLEWSCIILALSTVAYLIGEYLR